MRDPRRPRLRIRHPATWTFFVRKRSIGELGLTRNDLVLPLVTLALATRFFETVFWRGWVQSPFEDAFGAIPGIILVSALYALLFGIGLMFAVIFRITKSVFILWPLFQPFGQLMTLVKNGSTCRGRPRSGSSTS